MGINDDRLEIVLSNRTGTWGEQPGIEEAEVEKRWNSDRVLDAK